MKEIMRKKQETRYALEFDLEGFFNNIESRKVTETLKKLEIPQDLNEYIGRSNSMYPWVPSSKYEEEEELKITKTSTKTGETTTRIKLQGLPQGLSWSPILSTIVLNEILEEEGYDPTLYADDGILFSNEKEELKRFQEEENLKRQGIILSKKEKKATGKPATGMIEGEEIHFAGMKLNTKTGNLSSERGEIHISKPTREIHKALNVPYGIVQESRRREVHPRSLLMEELQRSENQDREEREKRYKEEEEKRQATGRNHSWRQAQGECYDEQKYSSKFSAYLLSQRIIQSKTATRSYWKAKFVDPHGVATLRKGPHAKEEESTKEAWEDEKERRKQLKRMYPSFEVEWVPYV